MKDLYRIITLTAFAIAFLSTQCHAPAEPRADSATIIRGPYLQSATPVSIVIRWRTDRAVIGKVQYGPRRGKSNFSTEEKKAVTEHILKIEGLEPGSIYHYSLGGSRDSTTYSFTTLHLPGKPGRYRIAAVGDCGNNSVNQVQVRDQLMKQIGSTPLDAWILLGDNAYSGGLDAEFQTNFFNIYRNTLLPNAPLFPSPGNHDYGNADSSQKSHDMAYYHQFTLPVNGEAGGVPSGHPAFYSYDLGNIHFLSLDSYGFESDSSRLYDTLGPQVSWIKKDLEANKNRGWIIAYWHHPPYTMGSHNSDEEEELVHIRENFIRVLERMGVDLVLCGHSHDYERSRLITGHYGKESEFSAARNELSHSSGRYDGSPNSCPFLKDSTSHRVGTVYVVSGSAGQLGGKQESFPHAALPFSEADHGGVSLLEIEDNRLDLKWICADGVIRDHFTMMKEVNQSLTVKVKKGDSVTLSASYPGSHRWTGSGLGTRSITVTPQQNTVYEVTDDKNCLKDRFTVEVSDQR